MRRISMVKDIRGIKNLWWNYLQGYEHWAARTLAHGHAEDYYYYHEEEEREEEGEEGDDEEEEEEEKEEEKRYK